jgi:hypothetical protein
MSVIETSNDAIEPGVDLALARAVRRLKGRLAGPVSVRAVHRTSVHLLFEVESGAEQLVIAVRHSDGSVVAVPHRLRDPDRTARLSFA